MGNIKVGTKGVLSYVLAVQTQFEAGETKIVVQARGKAIPRAIDAVEIVDAYFYNIKKEAIISTDTFEHGQVSSINITIWRV